MTSTSPTVFTTAGRRLSLTRVPVPSDPSLRAWDAADELVLDHLAEQEVTGDRWLVVNDAFGALGVALAAHAPQSWSDSWLAHRALEVNLEANGESVHAVAPVPSTMDPIGPFDVVVIKVPRTLAHLRDQLLRLRPLLADGAHVVGAGMVKHVHTSTIAAFEEAIGPTPTSHARRKARLLHATLDPDLSPPKAPPPVTFSHDGFEVVGHANVFSREHLDHGARILLANLPKPDGEVEVVDLGCGNGVLGAVAAKQDPKRTVIYVDESYGAVESALATHANAGTETSARGVVGDGLKEFEAGSLDLVLCNPPFHAQGARVDDVAREMFREAGRCLRIDGAIIVVGNRHLGHHILLRKHFKHVEVLGSDEKFVVHRGRRPKA